MNVFRAIVIVATVSMGLCLLPHYLGFAGLFVGTGLHEIGLEHLFEGIGLAHETLLCLIPTTLLGVLIAVTVAIADRAG